MRHLQNILGFTACRCPAVINAATDCVESVLAHNGMVETTQLVYMCLGLAHVRVRKLETVAYLSLNT